MNRILKKINRRYLQNEDISSVNTLFNFIRTFEMIICLIDAKSTWITTGGYDVEVPTSGTTLAGLTGFVFI